MKLTEHERAVALKSIDRRAAEIRELIASGSDALVYVLATTTAHVGRMLLRGVCDYPGCYEVAVSGCDCCDALFCDDHGSKGGDRYINECEVAVPSVCWKDGGYNAG